MNIKIRKNKTEGITIVTLSITIIVLLILAGIAVYSSKEMIQRAKLEELKTNMLLIQAKAREYVEEANFKMGINPETKTDEEKDTIRKEVYAENAQLEKVDDGIPEHFNIDDRTNCYWLTDEAQNNWGLGKIELADGEKYLIRFDEQNVTVEVYYTEGYEDRYSLTDIEKIQE